MKSTLQPGSEIVPETICLQGVGADASHREYLINLIDLINLNNTQVPISQLGF